MALLRQAPVIPVLTVADAQAGLAQARALLAGGLPIIEITLRTPEALAAITAVREALPRAIVGAGTVLEPAQIAAAVSAGAMFLVSPGATSRLAAAGAQASVPYLPGAASASEAMALREHGFSALKFFPAEAAGGVRHLAALAAPLSDLLFCPTGGLDAEKAKSYLALPNVPCVGGSWMVPASALASGDFAEIERLARQAAALRLR